MSNIQIGDHVSWQQRSITRPYLHTVTGVVKGILDEAEDWPGYAMVRADDGEHLMLLMLLTRVVGPIEAIADDYDMAKRHFCPI